ncbi:hypothetical protein [Pseudomonas petrae]|uniref:Uncharacterized protein n=1 Tax=Pseudomonas petrae TaxID=2912190 RepID=A0ABS9I9I7_9PSED|nr:hypothetical protein [Pseudomonas petrae]MCF7534468.1 hypothetical protein [Pseudomonas petrae]MCF7539934.1 hypothetical protein [Pseudomonas petrae]MCF7544082.1 hypothetical protein [Pseudomonas petrae]MCF7558248.1 hypothetical protein [Pseudomonas petrae]
MISQIQAAVAAVVSNKKPILDAVASGDPKTVDKAAPATTDKATFSTLAAQLNESAARAEKRDAGMTHAELGQYGRNRINEFLIESREANSGTRAMEVPKTNDPELLDRAREASAFVTRTLAGDKNAKSPFENLSRGQLNLIAFDDSGTFTLNERRAAWQGVQKMDEDWRKVAINEGVIEQARTGKATRFYNDALSYLKSLPAIEKAVSYPKGAEAIVEARIKSDLTLPGLPGPFGRQAPDRKLTLYDILAGIVDTTKDKKSDPNNIVHTKKFSPRTSPVPTTAAQEVEKPAVSSAGTQVSASPKPAAEA